LLNLEETLHDRVIGQNDAVTSISKARSCNVSSKLSKRSDSVSLILVNGIPVHPAITSAISSLDNT
jgi:ATP-dependent Clp protease ATP-binding subunit ClpA